MKPARFEKHLFIPDLQIPDQNKLALEAVHRFIPDFRPDYLHFIGDVMNFTKMGSYTVLEEYDITIGDEIREARQVVIHLTNLARKSNPECKVYWFGGNHELRLERYLANNAVLLPAERNPVCTTSDFYDAGILRSAKRSER